MAPLRKPESARPMMVRLVRRGTILVALLGGLTSLGFTAAAYAQGSGDPAGVPLTAPSPISSPDVLPEDVAAVARELNCPLCQGYNLQDCPLVVCGQMREQIARQLAEGRTAEAIKAGFVADYGPQVLNTPPARGFYLAAWVLPVVILALGALGLGLFWRRAGRAPRSAADAEALAADPAPPDALSAAYVERLERLAAEEEP